MNKPRVDIYVYHTKNKNNGKVHYVYYMACGNKYKRQVGEYDSECGIEIDMFKIVKTILDRLVSSAVIVIHDREWRKEFKYVYKAYLDEIKSSLKDFNCEIAFTNKIKDEIIDSIIEKEITLNYLS